MGRPLALQPTQSEKLVCDRRKWLHTSGLKTPVRVQQSAADGASLRRRLKRREHRSQGVSQDDSIRVQKEQVPPYRLPSAEIVRSPKAYVLFRQHQLDPRKVVDQCLARRIGRVIVDDDNLVIDIACGIADRSNALLGIGETIPVDENNREFSHMWFAVKMPRPVPTYSAHPDRRLSAIVGLELEFVPAQGRMSVFVPSKLCGILSLLCPGQRYK